MSESSSLKFESLPAEEIAIVNQHCDRFEQAWRQGETPNIEHYLSAASDSIRQVLLHELILIDAAYRQQSGTALDPNISYARFRDLNQRWLAENLHTVVSSRPSHPAEEDSPSSSRYEIVAEVGRGGMGIVYKALDRRLGRPVCLKSLHPEMSSDPQRLARFLREARVVSSLNHPNICTLFELEEQLDPPQLVLEWIDGATFRQVQREGCDLQRTVDLTLQVAKALDAAHAAGIVHRDIKPENLMVRDDGLVKVLDFGLARLVGIEQIGHADSEERTAAGALLGTAKYMSPEQARGEPVTSASDIFSLGIVLYELATGHHPFPGSYLAAVLSAIAELDLTPAIAINPDLDARLAGLLGRMLEKKPGDRPTARKVTTLLGEASRFASDEKPLLSRVTSAVPSFVGREAELRQLVIACEAAEAGQGNAVFVSGEAGIGKTALLETFIEEVSCRQRYLVLHGRCSQRLSSSDAYLPILDALSRCVDGPDGSLASETLKEVAPAWAALTASSTDALSRVSTEGGQLSQGRLKREFRALLDALSQRQPVLLFIDDLHWSDESTVDLLSYLGQDAQRKRLLILGTYRPVDSATGNQPFEQLRRDFVARGWARDVALPFLSPDEVATYLDRQFPAHRFPDSLAELLHERTEGSPLFIHGLVRILRERDVITEEEQSWVVAENPLASGRELPESIANLIEATLSQLTTEDRQLLQSASVQGVEFDAAVVADALHLDRVDVEERLQEVERLQGLLRTIGEVEFRDGTLTVRHAFVHVLFQEALYAAITPARRAAWSLEIARVLTELHGQRAKRIALELAFLYETGRNFPKAIECLLQSARHDVMIGANREAAEACRRGLQLLQKLPACSERDKTELELQFTRGFAETFSRGYGSDESREAYHQAEALCAHQPEEKELFSVLHGLWSYYLVRMDSRRQLSVEERLLKVAKSLKEPAFRFGAHATLALSMLHRGRIDETDHYLRLAVNDYEYRMEDDRRLVEQMCAPFGPLYYSACSWMHQLQDREGQSLFDAQEAVDCAAALGVPQFEIKFGWHPMLYYLQRDAEQSLQWAKRSIELSRQTDFDFSEGVAQIIVAWASAVCENGDLDHRLSLVDQGLSILAERRQRGIRSSAPPHLCMLGEASALLGRDEMAQSMLNESIAFGRKTGERWWESEALRQLGRFHERNLSDHVKAEANYREGLELAESQGVILGQRRCRADLARLNDAKNQRK